MGLTKQYLHYRQTGVFNVITSERPNVSFATVNKTDGRYVAVGTARRTLIWDLKLSEKTLEIDTEKEEVTAIRPSPDKLHLVIGYANGTLDIYNIVLNQLICSLALHRSAINVLKYDESGLKLVSGGQDTDLVVVDVVAQIGKCRLTGHTGPITDTCFYEKFESILISSSKDTKIKFWDLETGACFKTIVDHSTEVWGLILMRDNDFLVTGSGDFNLNVYKLTENTNDVKRDVADLTDEIEESNIITCTLAGSITRIGKGRTVNLASDPTGKIMACHGTDNLIELFYFCNFKEAQDRLSKRLKKLSIEDKGNKAIALNDEIRRLSSVKTDQKIKSIDLVIGVADELRLVSTCANNLIQLYSINTLKKDEKPILLKSINFLGHRTAPRSLCFSSDGLTIASGSGDSLKVWIRKSLKSIKTIEGTGHILCCCFVPGDKYVLMGLKSGHLLIANIVTGEIIEKIAAHTKELWSICLMPDLRGCVTAGGDTTIKGWLFELIETDSKTDDNKEISLIHKTTHQLEEAILCMKLSANNKFIAVGLLDSTIKIFFADSFKFYLSLYGHKLPVLCLDISDDSALIATGSADRNMKIWGMDFGDCHRSLFAHGDSVMAVQFVPRTHLIWTCGKDGKIKQWDGDTFQKIITFPGHIGEAYNLSIDLSGLYFVTCGSDKTIRLFEKTDEPLVLQDVQEDEREEMERKTLAAEKTTTVPMLPNLNLPSRKTMGAEKGTETILECLEIIQEFEASEDKTLPPLMMAYEAKTPTDYLVAVLSKITANDLEESLIVLPFSAVCEILQRVTDMIDKRKDYSELIVKVVLLLFRIHHKTIVGNHTFLPVLQKMLSNLTELITQSRDVIGENKFALQMLLCHIEQNDGVELFKDATRAKKMRDKKIKKKELKKRLHIQMV